MSDPKDHGLWHQSGVNQKGEPFVQLLQDDTVICQMDPQQARDHARAMIEAAEAAEQDAFMLDFAQQKIDLTFENAMMLVVAFRKYRSETTNKRGGPTRPEDWVMPPEEKRGE